MIEWLVRLIPLFPLLACLATLVLGARVLREKSHWPAILGCGLSALCSLALVIGVNNRASLPEPQRTLIVPVYQWINIAGEKPLFDGDSGEAGGQAGGQRLPRVGSFLTPPVEITILLSVDSLSATMLAVVTFVSTLVMIYAAGYMHGERGYWRFFTELALFVFSMIMLVLSGNFLELYVFWEGVGLCSYLLIGFWYEKPSAAAAGKKAFLVNRIGDFGFVTGIFLIWRTFGSLNFSEVLAPATIVEVAARNPDMLAWICTCLFLGAMGKSAQFPLHVWLPDAMEGPTPVSALMHAATMVTAGVYMVARCTPLFQAAPQAQMLVAFIGGFTALLAALIALTQNDLKRVLAYSTVSQLGYMFLGLGTGLLSGVSAAVFHLATHAFFKALLFLGAGSVMHAMGGVIDVREFSGLRKVMPQTYRTFLVGSLALAGLVPLSGFWSKDAILSAAHEVSEAPTSAVHVAQENRELPAPPIAGETYVHDSAATAAQPKLLGLAQPQLFRLLFWMGSFTALLTAFYTFRAFFMTFHGPEKIPHEAGHHAHESPSVMCVPLWVLAVGAVLLGGLLDHHTTGIFDRFLNQALPGIEAEAAAHHGINWFVIAVSTAAAMAGILAAWAMYGSGTSTIPARVVAMAGPLTDLSRNRFYLDEVYAALFVWPLRGLAGLSRFLDWGLIDGLVVGGIGKLPTLAGRLPRPIQNGLVQFYALAMMLALGVLLWVLLTKQA